MSDAIYVFNGKDIIMNVCIQIRAVIDVLQDRFMQEADGMAECIKAREEENVYRR